MNSINSQCHNCNKYFILKYSGRLEDYIDKHPEKMYCLNCRKEAKKEIDGEAKP